MLALCHDLKAADYAQIYAGIILASLTHTRTVPLKEDAGGHVDLGYKSYLLRMHRVLFQIEKIDTATTLSPGGRPHPYT